MCIATFVPYILHSAALEWNCIKWTRTIYLPDYEIGSQPYVQVSIYNGGDKGESHELNDEDQSLLGQCNFNIFEVLEKSKEAGEGLAVSVDYGHGRYRRVYIPPMFHFRRSRF